MSWAVTFDYMMSLSARWSCVLDLFCQTVFVWMYIFNHISHLFLVASSNTESGHPPTTSRAAASWKSRTMIA
jgi:hypothetical protein